LLCSVWIPDHLDGKKVRFFIALFNPLYWITGSTLGALGGALLNIDLKGIEFTMTALFIVIFIEQWISAAKTTRAPGCGRSALRSCFTLDFGTGPIHFAGAGCNRYDPCWLLRPSLDRRGRGKRRRKGSSVPPKR
jgi:hypothetical protein